MECTYFNLFVSLEHLLTLVTPSSLNIVIINFVRGRPFDLLGEWGGGAVFFCFVFFLEKKVMALNMQEKH